MSVSQHLPPPCLSPSIKPSNRPGFSQLYPIFMFSSTSSRPMDEFDYQGAVQLVSRDGALAIEPPTGNVGSVNGVVHYRYTETSSDNVDEYWPQGLSINEVTDQTTLPNQRYLTSRPISSVDYAGDTWQSVSSSSNHANSPNTANRTLIPHGPDLVSQDSFGPYSTVSPTNRPRSHSSELVPSSYPGSNHLTSTPTTPNYGYAMPPLVNNSTPNLDAYREQLRLFQEALQLPMASFSGPFIPQKIYIPHTSSDRRRYVEETELQSPIYFWMDEPVECGIPLVEALHSRVRRLQFRNEPVFEGRGPSISVRIQWPGYRPWSRQIPTKDFRSPPGPITRTKLVKNVAKCVDRFLAARSQQPLEDRADLRWKIGPLQNEIKLDDLILVSMHHVSMGSWQPHLRLRRPIGS